MDYFKKGEHDVLRHDPDKGCYEEIRFVTINNGNGTQTLAKNLISHGPDLDLTGWEPATYTEWVTALGKLRTYVTLLA